MARWHRSPQVLEAAAEWRDRCLMQDGSILSGRSLWTLDNLAYLEQYFTRNLDTGTGRFLEKLQEQLAPAPPEAKQLAAEMLWLLYLSVSETSMRGGTKRLQIRDAWQWSREPLPHAPAVLGEVLDQGVANPGTGFQTHRWRELVFVIDLAQRWKRQPVPVQRVLIEDPWSFARWVDSIPSSRGRQFRHMLLYLLFPEHFERVVTGSHKELIIHELLPETGHINADINFADRAAVDQLLYELRPDLQQRYGPEMDYYTEPLRSRWLAPKVRPPASARVTPAEPAAQPVPASYDVRVWVIAAGEGARLWPEFVENGIVAIGWDYLGDLSSFASHEDVLAAIRAEEGGNPSNNANACWQFSHDVRRGDVVVVKKGRQTLLGYGIVTSDYRFDEGRSEYQHTRSVNWRRLGSWTLPPEHGVVPKTLTEYTPYPEWVHTAFRLMDGPVAPVDGGHEVSAGPPEPLPYTREDAESDVFLEADVLTSILDALARKKNVILEGAPGVGKTYAARRIAWALMGTRDGARVELVQFHQSYGYEEFVQGWRPAAGGFELRDGIFHRFCARAAADPDRPYVFIIDEINRGNLSRIFGELLMLIEADKRGPEFTATLANSPDERFHVPANVHILGMMNTADRSLAMVDYALRRRFSFIRMEPAFGSERFINHLIARGMEEDMVRRVNRRLVELNQVISDDQRNLGPGFQIGHSYFVPAEGTEQLDGAWYEHIVRQEIRPLLREYWFDQPDQVEAHVARLLS
ncbi:AAA family ATPase [Longimicrobium terrae]|uniref:MoxR-like ATPase n=1 Tax=Longimicrobium terrae TaxID=1639882 RepID=A0A841GZD2_9BACT|nr:AAA family ATPase [Longimicrobium terrae]MBB4636437.1 MoxR-like ATPase [Longimicrobium terrae]MBB6071039.1 MoxR-like ATPase [Longimicrobium terrae]NNC29060.1 AAA domain-containing protein [Longimicrobium terrae]